MKSSALFNSEKKSQNTIVVGSSSAITNKPKETNPASSGKNEKVTIRSQPKTPVIAVKQTPRLGRDSAVASQPKPVSVKQSVACACGSQPVKQQPFGNTQNKPEGEAESRAEEFLNYLRADRWLWDMRCWNNHKDLEEVARYVENPTYKNSGHAEFCVRELKKMGVAGEEIIKAIMENPHIQYADYEGEKHLNSIMEKDTAPAQATTTSISQPAKKPVVMVQPTKKVSDPAPKPIIQTVTKSVTEETENDGVVLAVDMVKVAVGVLGKVVPKHSSISVLEYVKIEHFDSRVRLIGSNLEKSLVVEVPYANRIERLKSPLAVSLEDLKRLSKVKANEIRFGRENGNVVVSYATDRGGRNEVLRKVDLTEFPEIPSPQGEFKPVKGLGLALSEAWMFCADEIGRYALTGILLAEGEVISSDGKRLYRRFVPELKQKPSILIPSCKFFGLKEVAKEDIGLLATKEIVWLKMGNVFWSGRLVEGKFPEYEKLFPENCENALTLTDEVVEQIVQILDSLPYGEQRVVKIEFLQESQNWKMVFTSLCENPGTAEIQGVNYQGSEIKVGLNADYLKDALNVAGVKMMGLNGTENPVILWGDEVQILVMPLMASAIEPQPASDEGNEMSEGESPEETGEETPEGEEQEPEEGGTGEVLEEAHQEG